MNDFKKQAMKLRAERTIENLIKNNMRAYYCETSEEARELVKTLIKPGDVISNGGSVTLKETGIADIINSDDYNYLDRSRPGITSEEINEIYRKTYSADVYFTSANAVTEGGLLYNVDGNSNRVSAILYGPKSVIVVCGINKIVSTLDEAVTRVKTTAAPPNTLRLNMETYCKNSGECLSLQSENPGICDGCRSESRICCNYVISAYQRVKDRIKVIIIGEELGF